MRCPAFQLGPRRAFAVSGAGGTLEKTRAATSQRWLARLRKAVATAAPHAAVSGPGRKRGTARRRAGPPLCPPGYQTRLKRPRAAETSRQRMGEAQQVRFCTVSPASCPPGPRGQERKKKARRKHAARELIREAGTRSQGLGMGQRLACAGPLRKWHALASA